MPANMMIIFTQADPMRVHLNAEGIRSAVLASAPSIRKIGATHQHRTRASEAKARIRRVRRLKRDRVCDTLLCTAPRKPAMIAVRYEIVILDCSQFFDPNG
jgi:hypothetical protein